MPEGLDPDAEPVDERDGLTIAFGALFEDGTEAMALGSGSSTTAARRRPVRVRAPAMPAGPPPLLVDVPPAESVDERDDLTIAFGALFDDDEEVDERAGSRTADVAVPQVVVATRLLLVETAEALRDAVRRRQGLGGASIVGLPKRRARLRLRRLAGAARRAGASLGRRTRSVLRWASDCAVRAAAFAARLVRVAVRRAGRLTRVTAEDVARRGGASARVGIRATRTSAGTVARAARASSRTGARAARTAAVAVGRAAPTSRRAVARVVATGGRVVARAGRATAFRTRSGPAAARARWAIRAIGAADARRLRVGLAALVVLACVALGAVDVRAPAPPAAVRVPAVALEPLVVVVGDAAASGIDLAVPSNRRWPALLARTMHVRVRPIGDEGAGYLTRGAAGASFEAESSAVPHDARVVVFFGGGADSGRPALDVLTAASRSFAAALDRASDAHLIVVGPAPGDAADSGQLESLARSLRAATLVADGTWVDPAEDKTSVPASSGDAELAARLEEAIRSAAR